MNTGIQDALNLSFKLKSVLSGVKNLAYLDGYEKDRLPVAKAVLRGTDFIFKMALLPETPLTSILRRTILPQVVGSAWAQKRMAAAISEMAIAKKEIAGYL